MVDQKGAARAVDLSHSKADPIIRFPSLPSLHNPTSSTKRNRSRELAPSASHLRDRLPLPGSRGSLKDDLLRSSAVDRED